MRVFQSSPRLHSLTLVMARSPHKDRSDTLYYIPISHGHVASVHEPLPFWWGGCLTDRVRTYLSVSTNFRQRYDSDTGTRSQFVWI